VHDHVGNLGTLAADSLLDLARAGVRVVDAGAPQDVEPELVGAGCTIVLDLALGEGSASYLTSDLSYDYVRINADYRS
jgi:glutamate N-acetyltransferase/amino-acid N-acetyltransferase